MLETQNNENELPAISVIEGIEQLIGIEEKRRSQVHSSRNLRRKIISKAQVLHEVPDNFLCYICNDIVENPIKCGNCSVNFC